MTEQLYCSDCGEWHEEEQFRERIVEIQACPHKEPISLFENGISNPKSPIYERSTPERIFYDLKYLSEKRHKSFDLEKEEFIIWWHDQDQECFYCKTSIEDVLDSDIRLDYKVDRLTIDRLNNEKGYQIDNIVLACNRCNSIKSNFFTFKEMQVIAPLIHKKYIANLPLNRRKPHDKPTKILCTQCGGESSFSEEWKEKNCNKCLNTGFLYYCSDHDNYFADAYFFSRASSWNGKQPFCKECALKRHKNWQIENKIQEKRDEGQLFLEDLLEVQ